MCAEHDVWKGHASSFSVLIGLDLADTEVNGRKKFFAYAGGFANPRKPTYIITLKI
jgi:hypothetical protein